jgi:hypothetical protein
LKPLGELLLERGLLTEAQLQLALAAQKANGAPLGEILVRLGFSRGPTIGNALAEQHGGPLRTEYGLALGPTSAPATPSAPLVRTAEHGEQGTALARLTAALHERTQELERVEAELAGVRAQHETRVRELERQLEENRWQQDETTETVAIAGFGHLDGDLQRAPLVAAARGRAQRRYGPPLRTVDARRAADDRDPHGSGARAVYPDQEVRSHPIRVWHLAVIVVLVPLLLLTFLVQGRGLFAAVFAAVLGAAMVVFIRWTSRATKSASSRAAARTTVEHAL